MVKKLTRKNLEKFLAAHATPARVLDIGAGGSSYSSYFPNRFTIDIDPARKPDRVADAHELPFKDGEFEYILCTEVLEHLREPARAIAEMRRVLRPSGTLLLTTRFVYPLHDVPGDYWRFTKYGLQELFREWEIVELVPETRSFSTIAVLLQRIVFQSRLRFDALSKLVLLAHVLVFDRMNFLIQKEYGDIKKESVENHLMPAGYYLVCKKK